MAKVNDTDNNPKAVKLTEQWVQSTSVGATVTITNGEVFLIENTKECAEKLKQHGLTVFLYESKQAG